MCSKEEYYTLFSGDIDTCEKAYLLGSIAGGECIVNNGYRIRIETKFQDNEFLKKLHDIVSNSIKMTNEENVCFDFDTMTICKDICRHLNIDRDENSRNTMRIPDLLKDTLKWVFIRGVFDANGTIIEYTPGTSPECSISSESSVLLHDIKLFTKIPCTLGENQIHFQGSNCIDFLGKVYENVDGVCLDRKYNIFIDWLTSTRCYELNKGMNKRIPECYVYKSNPNAIFPTKAKPSDVGYDLSVIKKEKTFMSNVTLYDTGIRLRVNHGLYAEIVPRSSLSKSGYMLANSTGIIDPSYNGNLFVALVKINPDAPDITFPFKCCQIIFRKQIPVDMIEVYEYFDETSRNEGGFGSTGV